MTLIQRSVSTVVRAPDPPVSGTLLVVSTGHAAKFTAGTAHLHPAGVAVTAGNTEVVTVAPLTGDVLTITRAQSGSTAYAVREGDVISQGIAIADWDSLPIPGSVSADAIEAAAEVGGLVAANSFGRLTSGFYYMTSGSIAGSTSAVLGVGTLRLYPWVVPNACTISRLGAEVAIVGEAGSKVRLGIYEDNGSAYPGALLVDAGTINGDSATVQDLTISLDLTPGLHWIGGAVQVVTTTQPTMRSLTGNGAIAAIPLGTSTPGTAALTMAYSQTGVTGALPATFTSTVSPASIATRCHVKVA